MCHGHRAHWRGYGFRGRRFPNREEWLQRLEEYQRDLEQEAADVAERAEDRQRLVAGLAEDRRLEPADVDRAGLLGDAPYGETDDAVPHDSSADRDVHGPVDQLVVGLDGAREAVSYELLERLPEVLGEGARIDMGNLYRILRALEEEGFISSEWDASAPGPAKRRYALTAAGSRLLYQWVEALEEAQARIGTFIERYERAERG